MIAFATLIMLVISANKK
ncbi:hypothetical protein [Megasphaera sp.]